MDSSPTFSLLRSRQWQDYELIDTGNGSKLERFGGYRFARPEVEAMWGRSLPQREWASVDAAFQPANEENGGHWAFNGRELERWKMSYALPSGQQLRFWAMTTAGRHLGVFPEAAPNWDLIESCIQGVHRESPNVLNLFGYTGLATLAAALAGARVTHVDASRKSVDWARENQALSGMEAKPIRWIVDDALKFVEREGRRGARYDGVVLDPPKFGRGPKGEIWEVYKSLPRLLHALRGILVAQPLFVILTVYAVKASAVHVAETLQDALSGLDGSIEMGELVTPETSAGRLLSQAVFARWLSRNG